MADNFAITALKRAAPLLQARGVGPPAMVALPAPGEVSGGLELWASRVQNDALFPQQSEQQ
jgi:hypothetical protein